MAINKPTPDERAMVSEAYAQAEKLGMSRVDYLLDKADRSVKAHLFQMGMQAHLEASAKNAGVS